MGVRGPGGGGSGPKIPPAAKGPTKSSKKKRASKRGTAGKASPDPHRDDALSTNSDSHAPHHGDGDSRQSAMQPPTAKPRGSTTAAFAAPRTQAKATQEQDAAIQTALTCLDENEALSPESKRSLAGFLSLPSVDAPSSDASQSDIPNAIMDMAAPLARPMHPPQHNRLSPGARPPGSMEA